MTIIQYNKTNKQTNKKPKKYNKKNTTHQIMHRLIVSSYYLL